MRMRIEFTFDADIFILIVAWIYRDYKNTTDCRVGAFAESVKQLRKLPRATT